MKFFIINLEHDIEKREKITKLCDSLGIDYEIIKAIYGKALSEDEIKNNVASVDEQLKYLRKPLSLGEIGCAMSHRYCYQKIIDDGLEEAIILEDDAVFDKELLEFLEHKNEFPKDLELLLLGHYWQVYLDDGFTIQSPFSKRFNLNIANRSIKRIIGRGNGAHGYYITKNGAKKLLDKMNKIYIAADHYTSNDIYINLYALFPVVIKTDIKLISSINSNKDIKKRSKFRKYFKLCKQKIMYFIPSLKKPKDYI